MLYAAFRRSPRLWAWDLRSPSIPIYRLEQGAAERTEIFESELIAPQHDLTNQRIRFDIDHGGRWIATGDQVSSGVGISCTYHSSRTSFDIITRQHSSDYFLRTGRKRRDLRYWHWLPVPGRVGLQGNCNASHGYEEYQCYRAHLEI